MPTTLVNTNPAVGSPPSDNMRNGQNYSFYLRKQRMTNPPLMYANLIASATSGIIIWDPYIHDADMQIFSNLNHGVEITLLTLGSSQSWPQKISNIVTRIKQSIPDEFKENTSLSALYINKDIHGRDQDDSWLFHDRFLIIDDSDFYIIGSSVGYHITATQSTGIMEISSDLDKTIIWDAYIETYNQVVSDGCQYNLQNLL